MSQTRIQTLTGQCHCGSIKYEAQGPITFQGTCTCRACQRATGTLASPNIQVPMETFTITSGSPTQFKAASGETRYPNPSRPTSAMQKATGNFEKRITTRNTIPTMPTWTGLNLFSSFARCLKG